MKKNLTSSVYSFANMRKGNFLYVDKTDYIWKLVEPSNAMYFLSRPRRFGKSLTVSTLKALFQGKKELFTGLAICDRPYDWMPHPVIHLDMNGRDYSSPEQFQRSLCGMVTEQAEENHVQVEADSATAMFRRLIDKLKVQGQVVILVDEYDKPVLSNLTKPEVKDYLQILKSFYSVIKAQAEAVRFAFVTGVTKFCHVSLFSDLNNLMDISMNSDYATMLGYTQSEFEANFGEWLAEVESRQSLSHEQYLGKIKEWYDGYKFHPQGESVYNPVSLASFFMNHGEFNNYWFSTGTPTFLMELIKQRDFGYSVIFSEPLSSTTFEAFEIDDIDPVTLLFQTGYLTISGSDIKNDRNRCWLDFPNREVSESFNTRILNAYSMHSQREISTFCEHLSDAIQSGNLPKFQKTLEVFFAGIPYDVHHKSEANFQNIFYAIFKLLGYTVHADSRTSDGRIDAMVETDSRIYLFEFKLDKDDSGLEQIREKEYFKPFLLSEKSLILVGAKFDTETGKLSGWQEETVIR